MERNDRACQELQSESDRENSSGEELDELELDAIAGGCSDMADSARAAGMRVMTTRDTPNDIIAKPPEYYQDLARALSKSK